MSDTKLFDFLNSINSTKEDILCDDNERVYNPFVINRFLSASVDTVLYANEMNRRPFLTSRMQYDYLRLSIRASKRYCKWMKKDKLEKIEILKKYFGYNTIRTEEIVDLISDSQYEVIKKTMCRGGINE